jgi:thiol-disulfide isomerase/thioredoxin
MTGSILFLKDAAFDANGRLLLDTEGKHTIVMFQADWCGHCKNAKPHFQRSAEQLNDVAHATVDCSGKLEPHFQRLADRAGRLFGVQGFPTFKVFDGKGDLVHAFELKERTAEGIKAALRKIKAI